MCNTVHSSAVLLFSLPPLLVQCSVNDDSVYTSGCHAGPPKDDKPDYEMATWAGVLPLHQQAVGKPIDDPQLGSGIPVPSYVSQYSRGQNALQKRDLNNLNK